MDKFMEFLPFLIPLIIAQFALLGYTIHHILTHDKYKRGTRTIWLYYRDCTYELCRPHNLFYFRQ